MASLAAVQGLGGLERPPSGPPWSEREDGASVPRRWPSVFWIWFGPSGPEPQAPGRAAQTFPPSGGFLPEEVLENVSL